MERMTSTEIREAFLKFFESKGHQRVDSSSLVPANDPTLLFTNAGMVQFKDTFLGTEKRPYTRAATSQKVMRVSGKHNDLEEVGPSKRHHTFFEMLGNFSFGDYFKLEAMQYAWELLTEVYKLPTDRLAVTIYEKDDESYDLWVNKVGVAPHRVARLGAKNNFWQMAETGPCGPNTEIHWDKYPERGEASIIQSLEEDDDRFLEIWNLVFMQFNRTQPDPTHSGEFDEPLPSPGVDTGMGLERITNILQQGETNYDTDLFTPIIQKTRELTQHDDETFSEQWVAYRVIADHIRSGVFMIADGVLPGSKGRDSVCRLILRRAIRFGTKLGFNEPFLAQVADTVIEIMGTHYTELIDKADSIKKAITKEERLFFATVERGLETLDEILTKLEAENQSVLDGETAFFLKATLGLPIQVTKDIVEERGFSIDMDAYQHAVDQHALDSGAGQAMGVIASAGDYATILEQLVANDMLPSDGVKQLQYGALQLDSVVVAIIRDGQLVNQAITGDQVGIVLRETPFYVESGGQVSDKGMLTHADWSIDIEGMSKPISGLIIHLGEVIQGTPMIGTTAIAQVDMQHRQNTTRHHTATHLLHEALRRHLGRHVEQRGSLVAPDRLRFDFVHDSKVHDDELERIEYEVNQAILQNYPVVAMEKPIKEAIAEGATALFGEKYGDVVRTINIGRGYSYELCGGNHVQQTAEIGSFVIVAEGSSSAGIRRIEALTGEAALLTFQAERRTLFTIAHQVGASTDQVVERIENLQEELSESKKAIERLQRTLARYEFDKMITQREMVGEVSALIRQVDGIPLNTLREMADWFRNEVSSGVLVLGSVIDNKPQVLVLVTDDLTKKGLHAGNLVREIAQHMGGGGGGRPNLAQAGGKDVSSLPSALELSRELIARQYKA